MSTFGRFFHSQLKEYLGTSVVLHCRSWRERDCRHLGSVEGMVMVERQEAPRLGAKLAVQYEPGSDGVIVM